MIQDYLIEIKFLCGYVRNILSENFRVLIDRLQYKLGNVSYRKQHVNECQPERGLDRKDAFTDCHLVDNMSDICYVISKNNQTNFS